MRVSITFVKGFFSTLVDYLSQPSYNISYMGLRKQKNNSDSDSPKVLGLDPMGWLFALVSVVVGVVTDTLIFENMAATAQKTAYPELALGLLMVVVFVGSAGTLFALLSAVRKIVGW